MSRFQCVYYQTDTGRIPVKEFIDTLQERAQHKYFEVVRLLADYGKSLPEPHSKCLGNELYELRFIGREGKIRVLYFFYHENKIVLTNAFIKKSGRTPEKEITTARQRRESYLKRQEGQR